MEKLIIPGNQIINGEITISGAKNSAVAIIPACIIAGTKIHLENIPKIKDVYILLEIIQDMGATIKWENEILTIDTTNINEKYVFSSLTRKIRASVYFMGSFLSRFKNVEIPMPGGCEIGLRPIDQHLKVFKALGADIKINKGIIKLKANELLGNSIYLDIVSVGATINAMLAAITAKGRTILENVSKEPEVVDTANFLNAIGASVQGAGTDTIIIKRKKYINNATHYSIIPDRIEAGTYMIGTVATKGNITIRNVIPKHLGAIIAKLKEAGAKIICGEDYITVIKNENNLINPLDIRTLPYPGFPTDLQPIIVPMLIKANGTSIVTENIFENRFSYVGALRRMGAKIKTEGKIMIIEGMQQLTGANIKIPDLRAGMGLLLAGLIAEDETTLTGINYIRRGYENFEDKLLKLGINLRSI